MSVIKLILQELANIASTIRYSPDLRDRFYDWKERYLHVQFKSTEADLDRAILCWVERLYIANSLAYALQYPEGDTITIPRLKEKDLEGSLISNQQLYILLRSLRYNLFTNSGRSFCSQDDMEKLTGYINRLMEELAQSAHVQKTGLMFPCKK